MRGRVNAIRTFKGLVADLRIDKNSMNNFAFRIIFGVLLAGTTTAQAQVNAADSVMNHAKGNKLSLGG